MLTKPKSNIRYFVYRGKCYTSFQVCLSRLALPVIRLLVIMARAAAGLMGRNRSASDGV